MEGGEKSAHMKPVSNLTVRVLEYCTIVAVHFPCDPSTDQLGRGGALNRARTRARLRAGGVCGTICVSVHEEVGRVGGEDVWDDGMETFNVLCFAGRNCGFFWMRVRDSGS